MKITSLFYSGNKKEESTLSYTDSLAAEFAKKAKAVFVKPDINSPAVTNFLGEGTIGIYGQLVDSIQSDIKKSEIRAKNFFTEKSFKILEFTSESGNSSDIIRYYGKFSDINIINKNIGTEFDFEDVISTLIFETGCGVILHPESFEYKGMKNIIIAWDGSFRAMNAIKNTIQFLQNAQNITILTVDESNKDLSSISDLQNYLEIYGVKAKHKNINRITRRCIGDEIIAEAEKTNCDLIVMGAYSHSKVRQMVLGGVTKFILANTTIPVLMKH